MDWNDYGFWEEDISLPTNWEPVCSLVNNPPYEWEEFHSFWSSEDRQFFWAGGNGCSCDTWAERFSSVSDFSNGDKDALRRAITLFADNSNYENQRDKLHTALAKISMFLPNPRKPVER